MMSQGKVVVYKSLKEVWKSLTCHKEAPEVRALLQLCLDTGLIKDLSGGDLTESKEPPKGSGHPFVVIEGMDGCGKTTLTRFLSEKLDMKLIPTPPKNYEIFTNARVYFDGQSESIRRAFYSLGNYLAAVDVANSDKPVVMDRYWHSTAAYAVANEIKSGDTTSVFDLSWPSDLLQPDVVIFLQVSETERMRRFSSRRALTNTKEEQLLAGDQDFRRNLVDCYKSILGPQFLELDVDGKKDESESKILNAVMNGFPVLKKRLVDEKPFNLNVPQPPSSQPDHRV